MKMWASSGGGGRGSRPEKSLIELIHVHGYIVLLAGCNPNDDDDDDDNEDDDDDDNNNDDNDNGSRCQ